MNAAFLIADEGADELEQDLAAAGVPVVGRGAAPTLLRDVLRADAQVIVARARHPSDALLPALAAVREHAPLPVLLFTADGDTDTLAAALDAGVDVCVVNGYAAHRLRPLLQLARLRFERAQRFRHEMQSLAERFEERKLVDRAKGILMGAAQVPEDEAFRLLRVGSMRLKQRVGRVSQQVIDAAHVAQAINRAGVLRMLSQRVVLQRALQVAGLDEAHAQAARLAEAAALARADTGLRELEKLLSTSTYGDLRAAAQDDWKTLAAAIGTPPAAAGGAADLTALADLDQRAEACLRSADRLVAALEAAGFGGEPHIVNLCGRQRMLGQRLAKQALLASLGLGPAGRPGDDDAAAAFERALPLLHAAPLGDTALKQRLDDGIAAWAALKRSSARLQDAPGRAALAVASEQLLSIFEDLTGRYERSLDLLIG